VTWSNSIRWDFRDRVIDFSAGLCAFPRSTGDRRRSCGPPSDAGACPAIRADGTHGIFSLRRFGPDGGCDVVSNITGLRAVRRSLAAIHFRRGIVPSEGESMIEKGRSDYEFSVQLPGFVPAIDPARSAISLASESILPWVLPLAGFRADLSPQRRGHDPATIISRRSRGAVSGAKPIRSWV
jgi:hypothetical protein